ncbi:MAG: hypothetical protein AB7O96_08990 [Pseudobdellovibrionaceae bacterium]
MLNRQKSKQAEIFVQNIRSNLLSVRGLESDIPDFPADVTESLREISCGLSSDFSSFGHGYLTDANRILVYDKASLMFAHKMDHGNLTAELTRKYWQEVVQDFYANDHWGLILTHQKPKKENKMFEEGWPYVWGFFQTAILMKVVVYYFGLDVAKEPTLENKLTLIGLLSFSACSMAFTAWKISRREKKKQSADSDSKSSDV